MNRSIRRKNWELLGASDQVFTLTFADLTIVLLAFFVFLDTIAVPNALRKSGVLDSLSDYFTRTIEFESATPKSGTEGIVEIAERSRFHVLKKDERFFITIPSIELFGSGDDQIKGSIVPTLKAIAELILRFELTVSIEGHTDNKPIETSRFPSNWELSAARAISVLRLFIESGVPAKKLSAAGRGEYRPTATNETIEGRAKNRRVVLIISPEDQEEHESKVARNETSL